MNRIVNVARIQLFCWFSSLALPWLILATSFGINVVIFSLIEGDEGANTTGGLVTVYVFVFIAFLVAVREYLPFTMGLSVTRRTFYAATSALAVVQSAVFATMIYLLGLVESATGGWGVRLTFFGVPFLRQDNPLLQILSYMTPMMAVAFLGLFIGSISKRWGANGVYALTLGSLVVFGGAGILVTWQHKWAVVGSWFAEQSPLGLAVGWPALLAAVAAAGSFLVLRRATP
ncbi:hypothetical protein [Parasphingorhabdus pacifica]